MIKILKKIAISFIVILSLFSCGNSIKIIDNNEQKVSLSQKFQKYFLVGAAINEGQILQKDQPSVSIIKKEFNNIGYNVYSKVMKGSLQGIPQNRERLIIVGIKKNDF